MGLKLDFEIESRPDPVMTFGGFTGDHISVLPRGYLEAVLDMNIEEELRAAIIAELSARLNVA